MKFGITSRSASGISVNGDAYAIKEWNEQTLLAVIDGLGHGEEASIAAREAKEYILKNHTIDIEQIITDLHAYLHKTRGVAAGITRIDRTKRELLFCGIGNTEICVVGDPPMHPASLEGILGMNLRKAIKFGYRYNSLRAILMHSDGISSRFNLSDYQSVYEEPQMVAEQIMAEWGKGQDDATIIIAVEDS